MKRLYQLLISTLLFLIPSNLFYVLTETGSRVHGLRVDYLLPKFYLSDVIIWALVCVYLFGHHVTFKKQIFQLWKKRTAYTKTFAVLILLLIARQFFAENPLIAVWTALAWIKWALLAYVLWQKRAVLTSATSSIAGTMLFQSVVAFWQWGTQTSIAGYWFLGETDLSAYAGLAKTTLGGVERVLPYGTTAHPNVLGGFLAVGIVILLREFKNIEEKKVKVIVGASILASVLALLLTQSLSAILALLLGIAVILLPKKSLRIPVVTSTVVILLLLAVTTWLPVTSDNPSITRRAYLNRAALHMALDHPLLGVGLQNFTLYVEKYTPEREVVRFVQPAHSVPVLFLAEVGFLGILLVFTIFQQLKTQKYLTITAIALTPLLFFDHYVLTLQTGQIFLLFFILYVSIDFIP